MKPAKEAAQASFENGDADLANAHLILNNPQEEGLFGIACFHCHQAVEKYLKGYLLLNGKQPPLIHDLKLLLDESAKTAYSLHLQGLALQTLRAISL